MLTVLRNGRPPADARAGVAGCSLRRRLVAAIVLNVVLYGILGLLLYADTLPGRPAAAIAAALRAPQADVRLERLDPADPAAGDIVEITVAVERAAADLAAVELSFGAATDGSASAGWLKIGRERLMGRSGTAVFYWDTRGLPATERGLAINVVFANGRALSWDLQPERRVRLREPRPAAAVAEEVEVAVADEGATSDVAGVTPRGVDSAGLLRRRASLLLHTRALHLAGSGSATR